MAFKIGTKKILSEQNISKIIMLGIGLRDKLENAEKGLISDYDETTTYTRGQAVYYNNYLYKCLYTTTGVFDESKWQLIGDDLELIEKSDIEAMLNLNDEQLKTLQSLILDSTIELSHVWSSSKTYGEIQNAIKKGEAFTLKELSKKMGASYKVVTSTADMTSTEYLYLLANANNAYDIYALIDGTAQKIGDTTIDLSNYYTKNEIDNDFLKKTDADSKFATITTVDGKVDKTSILTTISSTPSDDKLLSEKAINDTLVKKTDIVDNLTSTDTDKPLSANQGKVLKDEIDLKANDNEVVKKTDITTKIDSSSIDTQVPSAKSVFDNIKKNGLIWQGGQPLQNSQESTIFNYCKSNFVVGRICGFRLEPKDGSGYFRTASVTIIYCLSSANYGWILGLSDKSGIPMAIIQITENLGKWQKICTTSSVADIAPTTITFTSTTNYKQSTFAPLKYTVSNGICYVSGGINCVSPNSSDTQVSTLPKPKVGYQYCKTMGVASASNSVNTVSMIIGRSGELLLASGVAGGEYRCTFSYPIA